LHDAQREDELATQKGNLAVTRKRRSTLVEAAVASARAAGLHYTTDAKPGIRRTRHGSTFRYHAPGGRRITSADELQRIRSLVIPPAWEDVWICPDPLGHLQATGRDVRGRKQYRYHPKWRVVRDETKYYRMIGFAQTLPRIRERAHRDTRPTGMTRAKVLAAVVQLLEKTLIRVGNDEYAKQNHSFGLTTLRDGHVKVKGARVEFTFRGKSGVQHAIDFNDRRLARIVKACRDIPGYDLFQYYDEQGERQSVGSADVNEYLKEISGEDYTSKDFRTWAGTVHAAEFLRACGPCQSRTEGKRNIVRAVESVAGRLGNTKAVSRKCYIHPTIFDAYVDGLMTKMRVVRKPPRSAYALSESEAAVLALLQKTAMRPARRKAS
jgi:DNA topoisomerase I